MTTCTSVVLYIFKYSDNYLVSDSDVQRRMDTLGQLLIKLDAVRNQYFKFRSHIDVFQFKFFSLNVHLFYRCQVDAWVPRPIFPSPPHARHWSHKFYLNPLLYFFLFEDAVDNDDGNSNRALCKPTLILNFDNNDDTDSSTNKFWVNNTGVTFTDGKAYFNGKSRLTIPGLSNMEFGSTGNLVLYICTALCTGSILHCFVKISVCHKINKLILSKE